MTSIQPRQITGSSARFLFWGLVSGLLGIIAVFGLLSWVGAAPFLIGNAEAAGMIAPAMAACGLGLLALGWFWARPSIPLPSAGKTPGDFWDDPGAGARAVLLWVLWEGGSMIAAVGSLLTGSVLTESVAAIGLALLVTHSPGYLESRGE